MLRMSRRREHGAAGEAQRQHGAEVRQALHVADVGPKGDEGEQRVAQVRMQRAA